jgi:DNA-binding transcriptional regulator YdaS (Cro superfamily)
MPRAPRREWAKRIAAWKSSRLSGAAFAARIGVKEATLRHWGWKLRADVTAAHAPFVEVAAEHASGVSEFEARLPGRSLAAHPADVRRANALRVLIVLVAEGR